MYKFRSDIQDENLCKTFDFEYLKDGDIIGKEEDILTKIIHSPGHTDDHIYLLINENEIFCGDNVLGFKSTVLLIIMIRL